MTLIVALLLAAGLLLAASPWLWPAGARPVRMPRFRPIAERLAQAGLQRLSVGALALVSALVAVLAAAIVFALVPVTAIALTAGVAGLAAPFAIVTLRAKSRRKALRSNWPDVVDHLVSGVRSGLALPDSLVTLAGAGPESTRPAFRQFELDYRATGNFGLCIDALKDRLADPVADRILETLRMSREVGGSELTTVLRSLATYLRQEAAIRSEVEARQSWVVNAARLGAIAPWIVLLLLASRPEAAAAYNTPVGVALIVCGLGVSVVAYRLMIALGRIPEERRWFT
ncbi:MAG: type secretion system protein [Microbacteriaceae bacterium]|nr:type secretion system protein [Microbacteriaceae bacterium]